MHRDKVTPYLFAMAAVLFAYPAAAQVSSGGEMVAEAAKSISPVMMLLVATAYLGGVALVASGLMRLKDSSDRGDKAFGDGLMRLFGGSLLISLPTVLGVGLSTFFGDTTNYKLVGASPAQPTMCIGGEPPPDGALVCIAQNINTNLVPVFVDVSFALMVLTGVGMVAHAIYTMAMSQSQGQRNLPKGWANRLILGFLIANLPAFMYAIEQTFGIGDAVITASGFHADSSLLSYSPPTSIGVLANYGKLLDALLTIFVMFGVIAVWRGIFLLRAFADGNGQGSMGAGLTHIVGGVALANAKFTTCVVVNTFIGAGAAMGFC